MKKLSSVLLTIVMLLSFLPVFAADATFTADLSTATPVFTRTDGGATTDAQVFYLNTDDSATIKTYGSLSGWEINNNTASDSDSRISDGHSMIHFDLPNTYMNRLDGNTDVLVTVKYYDGESSHKGRKFCLTYNSQSLTYESAGIVTLGGTGEWLEHTFTLERPKFADVGNNPYLWNFFLSTNMEYMGSSSPVTINSVKVRFGEERDAFLTLDSAEVGNIFYNTDPVKLNINVLNPKLADLGEVTAKYVINERIDGTQITTGEQTINIESVEKTTQILDLSNLTLPYATYTIDVQLYKGSKLLDNRNAEFSRVNALTKAEIYSPVLNDFELGLNDHLTSYSEKNIEDGLVIGKRAGENYARILIGYAGMETGSYENPTFKTFEGTKVLKYLQEAKKNGMKVLGILGNCDPWRYPDVEPFRVYDENGNPTETTESEFQIYIDRFSAFCEYAAGELKDYVDAWEITNEYNWGDRTYYDVDDIWFPEYSDPEDLDANGKLIFPEEGSLEDKRPFNPKDYSDIIKACYPAVKKGDPDSIVVGGALGGTSSIWFDRLYKYGAGEYMDAISVHSYPENVPYLEEYDSKSTNVHNEQLKEVMAKYGYDHEIWITEFNYNTRIAVGGTETKQIEALTKFLIKNPFKNYFDKIFVYRLEEGYTLSGYSYMTANPQDSYDVVPTEFAARLQLLASAFYTKILANTSPVSLQEGTVYPRTENSLNKDDINYIAKFKKDTTDAPVYAVFNYNNPSNSGSFEPRPRQVTISEPGRSLVAYDMYGNVIQEAEDEMTVTATSEVIYVTEKTDFRSVPDLSTEKITIHGVGAPNVESSIIVLKDGVNKTDLESGLSRATYIDQVKNDQEGSFIFTFKVAHGDGTYHIHITDGSGQYSAYDVVYEGGEFSITYKLTQDLTSIKNFADIVSGDLNAEFNILNPDRTVTDYIVVGATYSGDELVDINMSRTGKLTATTGFASDGFTIKNIDKTKIDRVKFFLFNSLEDLKPLYAEFKLD